MQSKDCKAHEKPKKFFDANYCKDSIGQSVEVSIGNVWLYVDTAIRTVSIAVGTRGVSVGITDDNKPFVSIEKDGDIDRYFSL